MTSEIGYHYAVAERGSSFSRNVTEWGKPKRTDPGWIALAMLKRPQHGCTVQVEFDDFPRPYRDPLVREINKRYRQDGEPVLTNRAGRRAKGPRRD